MCIRDRFSNGYASYMLYFNAELVLQGELWRLVTWMFLPTNGSLFWIFISLSFYYFIGTSIEEYWGTAKFTLFYLACAVLMVVFGMISILWSPLPVVSSGNLNQILFLAFATLDVYKRQGFHKNTSATMAQAMPTQLARE